MTITLSEDPTGNNEHYNKVLHPENTVNDIDTWISFIHSAAQRINTPEPKHLVDLGCGFGSLIVPCLEKGFTITAIDSNPIALEHVQKATCGSVTTICLDFLLSPIPNEGDIYIMRSCLLNCFDINKRSLLMSRFTSSVRSGRIVIVEVFDPLFLRENSKFINNYQQVELDLLGSNKFTIKIYHKKLDILVKELIYSISLEQAIEFFKGFRFLSAHQATPLTLALFFCRE